MVFLISFDLGIDIYLFCKAQISSFKAEKAPRVVIFEYAKFKNIFFPDFAIKLIEYTEINNHLIGYINNYQPFYRPIYSLILVEVEILKIYMKIKLTNYFIKLSKSLTNTPILFVQNFDNIF